jgi:ribosomal protein S18 acetylase RimI-like enzyme
VWPLRSLGFRTDLFLVAFDGVVEDKGRYLVVRTPTNPDFWWGNFLLYPDAPDARAAARGHDASWLDDHDREFPVAKARLFAWDRPDGAAGEIDGFLREGFALDDSVILTATAAAIHSPPKLAADVAVVPLATSADWEGAARALTAAFAPNRSGTLEDLRTFVDRQLTRYRAMQSTGVGQWFGAFVEGELAGSLGVVRHGELGRFQLVGTDPRFGRRGVCSTLVHHAARVATGELGVTTLVMAADAGYHAAKVYESVGFTRAEHLVALLRKPARS